MAGCSIRRMATNLQFSPRKIALIRELFAMIDAHVELDAMEQADANEMKTRLALTPESVLEEIAEHFRREVVQ